MEYQYTIDALIAVLRKEIEAARSMETLLNEKQRAFIQWHTGDLESVVSEEEKIIALMASWEKERTALLKSMSRTHGRMLSIMELLDKYPSHELQSAYDELRTVAYRVIRKNNQNRDLVQSTLTFVRRTLTGITGNFRYKLLDQKV